MTPDLAPLFKAASEPARLRILNLLRTGARCVCDVQASLGLPQPTVSRHLAALRHAGLVRDRREGPRVLYSLARQGTALQRALLRFLDRACELDPSLCLEACPRPVRRASRQRRPGRASHVQSRRGSRTAEDEVLS